MLESSFREEMKKNNVLSNKSNKFGKLFFKSFNGRKVLTLYGNTYLNYCYLVLNTTNAAALKVYYKDILVGCISGSKQIFMPIAIENNSLLTIEGIAESLSISLFGAKFYNESCNYIIPQMNYKIEDCGKCVINSYASCDDFISSSFTKVKEYNKLYSSQVFGLSGVMYHANLYEDNGVYLCSNNDNYANKIKVVDNVKKATIVPTNLDKIYIVYIVNGKIYFKSISNFSEVSESIEIDKKSNLIPIGFCPIEVYDFYANIFAVVWNNGSISLFEYENNTFTLKSTIKGEKVKIQLYENGLNFIKLDDYGVGIYKYNLTSGGVTPKDDDKYNFMINVNDYYYIDNSNLYFNCEHCTKR